MSRENPAIERQGGEGNLLDVADTLTNAASLVELVAFVAAYHDDEGALSERARHGAELAGECAVKAIEAARADALRARGEPRPLHSVEGGD